MKTALKILIAFIITSSYQLINTSAFAQAPQKMSYQAVIRNSSNVLVTNAQIGMEIDIRRGSPSGTVVYTETQTPTTNANGLISIEIGGGVGFDTINWANGPYFIETNTALVPPLTTYTITGTSQLLSVPYALHAKTAESLADTIPEVDPLFNASTAAAITASDTTYWNSKLDSESDPVFAASIASGITGADTAYWNNKLDIETDPTFNASVAAGITSSDTSNWNHKFNLPALTSGSILFSNGTIIAQDNNNLFWDNTNKRLGIGTNSPGVQLEIKNTNSNLANAILKVINNNGDSILTVSGNRTDICLDSATGSFTIYQVASTQKNQLFRIDPSNCFMGYKSGINIGTGNNNFFAGSEAGKNCLNGSNNIFVGYHAGLSDTDGLNNVFIGYDAGSANIGTVLTGLSNVFIGTYAGNSNTYGNSNVFIGEEAGKWSSTGDNNLYMGKSSYGTSSGSYNVCLGSNSRAGGNNVTAVGSEAGYNSTGSNCVFLGYRAGYATSMNNILIIENTWPATSPLIFGDFSNNRVVINGSSSSNINNRTFFVNGSAGGTGAWWNDSDERLKKNIKTIEDPLKKVLALRGVNYEWKDTNNHEKGLQIGFIAQETVKILPEVVSNNGGVYAMQYAAITALLVEAIKEQQNKIESLELLNDKVKQLEEQNKKLATDLELLKEQLKMKKD